MELLITDCKESLIPYVNLYSTKNFVLSMLSHSPNQLSHECHKYDHTLCSSKREYKNACPYAAICVWRLLVIKMKHLRDMVLTFTWILLLSLSGKCFSQVQPRLPPGQQVPCFFIFGDSLVDNGNNNGILTLARANYRPYGIDFPAGATGRFTNGRTYVDALGTTLYRLFIH